MFKKCFSKILASGLSAFLSVMCFGANSNVFAAWPLEGASPSRDLFTRVMSHLPEEVRTLDFVVSASNAALERVGLQILTPQEQSNFESVYRRLDRDWPSVVQGLLLVHLEWPEEQ